MCYIIYRGVWSPGQASMFKDLPRAMQEEINMHDIYSTLVQVCTDTRVHRYSCYRTHQRRQRELKVGGTSLVSRLSACLTEANWWRLIAE